MYALENIFFPLCQKIPHVERYRHLSRKEDLKVNNSSEGDTKVL